MSNENEQPTLTRPELIAADVFGEGGDQRQSRLRELDRIAEQREADAATLTAMLRELDGSADGAREIAGRKQRIAQADAERTQALDALVNERASLEATVAQGIEAARELGEPNPHRAFLDGAQGRALADKLSQLGRALQAAGGADHKPPQAVAKALAERVLKRSDAFTAFATKVESVQKALDLRRPEALRKARESFPDLHKAAVDEPIIMPEPVTKAVRETIEKRGAADTISKLRRDLNVALLRNALWPGQAVGETRIAIQKAAASMGLDELVAAIMALGEEEQAKVLEALSDMLARPADAPVTKSAPERVEFQKASGRPFSPFTGYASSRKNTDGTETRADGTRVRCR